MNDSTLSFLSVQAISESGGNKNVAMKSDNLTFDDQIKDIIEHHLGAEFDTHEFINAFIKVYESEYVELLAQHKKADGVFKTLHSRIGKGLNRAARSGLIEKKLDAKKNPELRRSLNVKGGINNNHVWLKIN